MRRRRENRRFPSPKTYRKAALVAAFVVYGTRKDTKRKRGRSRR